MVRVSIANVRTYSPLLGFPIVIVVHHVLLGLQAPSLVTKGLLMTSLLAGVLLVGLVTDRAVLRSRRTIAAFVLLAVGIAMSCVGDIGLAVSLEFGMAWFILALITYIVVLLGPARARPLPWWAIPYGLMYSPIIAVLWVELGDRGPLIAFYGLLLMLVAVSSTIVGRVAGLGGFLFLVAEGLLGFRMFLPEALAWFPDPWQDVTISLLYCLAQGTLALGVLLRLQAEPRLAAERASRAERASALADR